MGWVRTAAVCFLFAIALARGFRAASVDSGVRAEARRVALSPGAPQDDPEVAAFRLSFDLHVANGSERPIRLPASGSGKANSVRAAVLGVDSEGPGGNWVHLLQASWYDNGTLSYEPCASLPPGGAGDVRGVKDGFVLLKKQLAGLGEEPTLRLRVMIFCRQPGGRVSAQEVATEGFQVRLRNEP